jgi:hypothetical protein
MRNIYKFIVLILAIAFVSCNESEESVDVLSIVESNVIFSTSGSNDGYIKVNSIGSYVATSNQTWCTVSINNDMVKVSAVANPELGSRAAIVTITSGDQKEEVSVYQYGVALVIDKTELIFADTDNTSLTAQTVNVICASPVILTIADDWVVATLSENILTVYCNSSPTRTRSTTITLTSGNVEKVITVTQRAGTPINQRFIDGDWFFAYSGLGPFGQAYWNYTLNNYEMYEELLYAYMGTWNGKYGFYFGSESLYFDEPFEGDIYYDYQLIGEDQVKLTLTGYDDYNGFYYFEYAYFNYLTYPIGDESSRTFTLTSDDPTNPTWIKLTEDSNPANTITLYADPVFYPYYY